MDRNREARRATIVGSNGFNRRSHRMSSLRDSPDEDGGLELQESVRLRERVKKDRDRERERDLERERERDLRERSNRSKRRRAERLTSNRDDIAGDETSDESVNDDEDEEDEEQGVRVAAPPPVGSISNHHHHYGGSGGGSLTNHQHGSNFGQNSNSVTNNHHLQHRKTFPPGSSTSKVFRSQPPWKTGDEMIGVSVPRKARSASTKRSNDWISSSSNNNSGGGGSGREQTLRQDSSSPARHGAVQPAAAAAPVSPSSNASTAKKLKTNASSAGGPKHKPPKASSKPNSTNPEELEIEIAEVLYGLMTQSHGPSSKKDEARETNRSNSSPISNSSNLSYPSMGANSSPLSVIAPKRKRPRQVPDSSGYGSRNFQSTDQPVKPEVSSEKANLDNGNEIGAIAVDSHETKPVESSKMEESSKEGRDFARKVEIGSSPKEKESLVKDEIGVKNLQSTATGTASLVKTNLVSPGMGSPKDAKFQIDLMAPPPQTRSSPEREAQDGSMAGVVNSKLVLSIDSMAVKTMVPSKKEFADAEEGPTKDPLEDDGKGRILNLQLDLEKPEREANSARNKSQQANSKQIQAQGQFKASKEEPASDKSGPSGGAVPLPLSMPGWPGGLPPVGYMTPLQGVVSMDGSSVTQSHLQPRPKRCATHCHIARNIQFFQNLMKMSPFWAGSPGAATMFGPKSGNINALPAAPDLQGGNLSLRAAGYNSSVEKGSSGANVPNSGKDKNGQATGSVDSRKQQQQMLIQQALPPVAAGGLMGPAFIFPLNQQPAAAAVGAHPGALRPATLGAATNLSTSSSSTASTMSFNYPNMAGGNESQYLAILPNNGYPFPVPVVGAPPNYRGAPPQPMPLFNGSSFYSSQMILPSQMQQPPAQHMTQLLQTQPPSASVSNGSSSHKQMTSQQSRSQNGNGAGGTGNINLHNFSSQKNQTLQQSQNQYGQQSQRTVEIVGEDDGRGARGAVNIYGQNIGIHPQNFTLMAAPSSLASGAGAAISSTSGQMDKKNFQMQQPSLKANAESLPPSFAMSFGNSINANPAGQAIDISSMANHAIFQSSSEAARQNLQMMAASAVAAQVAQKNSFRIMEDAKSSGTDSSVNGDDKKLAAGKALGVGHSIGFARSDIPDSQMVASVQVNNVLESSRSPGLSSANRSSLRPSTSNSVGGVTISSASIQSQIQQQQQQHQEQYLQLKQQQQEHQRLSSSSVNRSKVPVTSNGSIYSDMSSSPAKFRSALSGFPQNQVQSSQATPNQASHWKNSLRTPTSQVSSSTTTALKNLSPQQHVRASQQPVLTQISFGGNQKTLSTAAQGQAAPSTNQPAVSTPMMVASPSSVSKGAGGSPRMATPALTSKIGQTSPSKNSSSVTSQKSPSVLGNLNMAPSTNNGVKKFSQIVFPNMYMQSQSPHSASTSSSTSSPGGNVSKRRTDHQQTSTPATSGSMSTGVLSLNTPVPLSGTTSDPVKAITANAKTGGALSQSILNATPFHAQTAGNVLPANFSYLHQVSATAVQVKPAEQKQPPA